MILLIGIVGIKVNFRPQVKVIFCLGIWLIYCIVFYLILPEEGNYVWSGVFFVGVFWSVVLIIGYLAGLINPTFQKKFYKLIQYYLSVEKNKK